MAKRKGGLGRGLDALFADAAPLFEEDLEQNEEENIDTKLLDIIDDVTGDKSRERFDLKSKAKSNKNHKTKSDRDETKGNNLNSTKEDKTPREHAVQLEERNIKDQRVKLPKRKQIRRKLRLMKTGFYISTLTTLNLIKTSHERPSMKKS